MARIPYPTPEEIDPDIRAFQERLPGANVMRMMAGAGPLLPHFARFGNAILNKTAIDPKLRELAILRVGHHAGAAYEVHHHERIGRAVGMSEAQIDAARLGGITQDPLERLVLQFTDELVRTSRPTAATFDALHAALGARPLKELTLAIGFYAMTCYFLQTFDIDIETEGGFNAPGMVRPAGA